MHFMPELALNSAEWPAEIPTLIEAALDSQREGSVVFGPDLRVLHGTGRVEATPIHKSVYCSRNQIRGTPEEIIREIRIILSSARRNNPRTEVTGALLFNEGLFAQVLEGPVDSVSPIFEIIQRDPRHSDITVLENGEAERRDFPEWSMAFASSKEHSALSSAIPPGGAALSDTSAAGEQVLQLLRNVVVQEDWIMA